MGEKHEQNKPRLNIAAALCIILGLLIGFGIKRVHIGLLIGLGLGLLSGSFISRSRNR